MIAEIGLRTQQSATKSVGIGLLPFNELKRPQTTGRTEGGAGQVGPPLGLSQVVRVLSGWPIQVAGWCRQAVALASPAAPLQDHLSIHLPVAVLPPVAGECTVREALEWMDGVPGLTQEQIASLLGVSRQAVFKWRQGGTISDEHRRHVLAVHDVLGRAAALRRTPDHFLAWLDTPRGADGRTPAELLAAGETGRARMLALTTPSTGVRAEARWATRRAAAPAVSDAVISRATRLPNGERHPARLMSDEDDGITLADFDDDPVAVVDPEGAEA